MTPEVVYKSITRVELIDDDGRRYINWDAHAVRISIQDGGRTLKLFVGKINDDKENSIE